MLAVDAHPNADRLRVCQVDVGEGDARQIVCGAWNFEAGATVAVALPGAFLPILDQPLDERELRGQASRGMILAEDEIGLGDDHAGIIVLAGGPEPGTPLLEVLPIRDQVLDVTPTVNRVDLLSMVGLAREVAALLGGEFHPPVPEDPAVVDAETVDVAIEDFDGCPRYIGRVFRDVAIGPSPQWLRSRLFLADMRSISNVVDVTNYVMHVWGSPLHAFDRTRLAGGRIVVRRARPGRSCARSTARRAGSRPTTSSSRTASGRSRWPRSWEAPKARSPTRRLRCSSRQRTSSRSASCAPPSGSHSAPPARTAGRKASTRTSRSTQRCSRAACSWI